MKGILVYLGRLKRPASRFESECSYQTTLSDVMRGCHIRTQSGSVGSIPAVANRNIGATVV